MALKARKKIKKYAIDDIDDMIKIVNADFIRSGKQKRHFVITNTCFIKNDLRFMMCDSRESYLDTSQFITDKLPCYYGASIEEVVTKCFNDRANHG